MLTVLIKAFYLIGALSSGYFLVEGWLSQSVWIKGCTKGAFADAFQMDSWAVKRSRNEDSRTYWVFMFFYAFACMFFLVALFINL